MTDHTHNCPAQVNHLVEWLDHVHINGQCYALVPVRVAEAMWQYCNAHINIDPVDLASAGYNEQGYNADLDALHSELDPLKHGE